MKEVISILLLSILILGCSSSVETSDSEETSNKEISNFDDSKGVEMLESFYKEYIPLVENSIDPSEIESLQAQYCTKLFIQTMKEWGLDYDPLINAQDASAESINSLTVKRVSNRERTFYVSYIYPENANPNEIIITLEIVDGIYLISNIDI